MPIVQARSNALRSVDDSFDEDYAMILKSSRFFIRARKFYQSVRLLDFV
jgi:hypothetical protein